LEAGAAPPFAAPSSSPSGAQRIPQLHLQLESEIDELERCMRLLTLEPEGIGRGMTVRKTALV